MLVSRSCSVFLPDELGFGLLDFNEVAKYVSGGHWMFCCIREGDCEVRWCCLLQPLLPISVWKLKRVKIVVGTAGE